jgi:hypothetical protein
VARKRGIFLGIRRQIVLHNAERRRDIGGQNDPIARKDTVHVIVARVRRRSRLDQFAQIRAG